MQINNIYTRTGLLFLGLTFLFIGFFIDLKIATSQTAMGASEIIVYGKVKVNE